MPEAFQFGSPQTLKQDIEYGILQIVDIALKAISLAVNDPSTAISCVDQLSSILIRFAAQQDPPIQQYNPLRTLRVSIPYIGFNRLAESAFEQIQSYAKTDVAVSLPLVRAFANVMQTRSDGPDRSLLANYGQRLLRSFQLQLVTLF